MILPDTCPSSPIFAILTQKPRTLAAHCQAAGFNARPVVSPTVPRGTERVRVCLHAGNTTDQIDNFVNCLRTWIVSEGAAQQKALSEQTRYQMEKPIVPKI
jgi:8-amino-7-oxononanoate synthase